MVVKIIKDNSGYVTHQGSDCFSGCIVNYLNYKNININIGTVCALYDGFTQFFDYIYGVPCIRGEVYDAVVRFVERNGGVINFRQVDSSYQLAEDFIHKCINEEQLITLEVNTDYLEYDDIFKQSNNWMHFVNVIGYDDDNFYISDGYVPTVNPKVYEGKISRKTLLKAWKDRGYKYCILDIANFKNFDFNDADFIKKGLKLSLKKYVDCIDKEEANGYRAMSLLLKSIEKLFYEPDFNKICQEINHNFKAHGFFSTRYCLHNQLSAFTEFAEYKEKVSTIIEKYNLFCMLLLKSGFSKREKDLQKLLAFGNEVMESEKSIYSDLMLKL